MGPRSSKITRKTKETDIEATLSLDGTGKIDINTPVGFFNHMLGAAMVHGFFDLTLKAEGDTYIDDHHTVEDTGLVLGQAFAQALGDMGGIKRFGQAMAPMDEALASAVVDISGRPCLVFVMADINQKVGSFDTELVEEFWRAFVNKAGVNLHLEVIRGNNAHHVFEAMFKAAGKALDMATTPEERTRGPLSTKGVL